MTNSGKQKVLLDTISWVLHILLNIIFYVLVVLIVMRLSTAAYDFSYQIYGDVAVEKTPGTNVTIAIKQGESTMELAKKLKYNQLIVNQYSFFIRAKLSTGTENPILAGTYTLNTSMNYGELLDRITDPSANEEPAETKTPETGGTDKKKAKKKAEKTENKNTDEKSQRRETAGF